MEQQNKSQPNGSSKQLKNQATVNKRPIEFTNYYETLVNQGSVTHHFLPSKPDLQNVPAGSPVAGTIDLVNYQAPSCL